jgi:hypothetical protein
MGVTKVKRFVFLLCVAGCCAGAGFDFHDLPFMARAKKRPCGAFPKTSVDITMTADVGYSELSFELGIPLHSPSLVTWTVKWGTSQGGPYPDSQTWPKDDIGVLQLHDPGVIYYFVGYYTDANGCKQDWSDEDAVLLEEAGFEMLNGPGGNVLRGVSDEIINPVR